MNLKYINLKQNIMAYEKEITNAKGNKKVTIEMQDGFYYCSVWVNRCETCVLSGKEFKSLKGAENWAKKRMD